MVVHLLLAEWDSKTEVMSVLARAIMGCGLDLGLSYRLQECVAELKNTDFPLYS